MRTRSSVGGRARVAAVLGVLWAGSAAADANDLRLYQLGNPSAQGARATPAANGNFRAFARTLGAALTSANLMPPETLGHAAFSVTAELAVVDLPGADRVQLPTERAQPGTLLLPSLHVRKGLPFSFEIGARAAWVEKSRMSALTGELKWAATEGFAHLPDVALRLHATRLLGARDVRLTAAGLDVGVGKQFPLGGMVTLTPYGGLDLVGMRARSATVDFRPERTFEETLAEPLAPLSDTGVYAPVTLGRNILPRFYGGVRFIGGVLQLGAELSITRLGSFVPLDEEVTRSLPALLAFSATLGLDF